MNLIPIYGFLETEIPLRRSNRRETRPIRTLTHQASRNPNLSRLFLANPNLSQSHLRLSARVETSQA